MGTEGVEDCIFGFGSSGRIDWRLKCLISSRSNIWSSSLQDCGHLAFQAYTRLFCLLFLATHLHAQLSGRSFVGPAGDVCICVAKARRSYFGGLQGPN